ncbi:unnamed protein product [Thlaspi arvense]|uniref:Zinc finger PHD-type domain-containing protein n=1 Tax=Thlaspi arvense TaxID=13288 RepID=A0AAU9T3I9_THLAR|nr:unnamed protein product [Thlaspi arvense]
MTIESPKSHEHRLSLVPKMIMFTCHICELLDDRFPYACNICDLSFHKDCAESTPELNYFCHPKHPLKRLTRVPSYTDGKCITCFITVLSAISAWMLTVQRTHLLSKILERVQPKAHEHPLTLLPQRAFVCNACGILHDDPNPYVCLQCNFMVHRNCIDIPRIIKTSRHVYRISYNHCLTAGDWKCGVCKKEINWRCGAYSCSKCLGFAIHWRCATSFGIWDGIEYEGILEDIVDSKSYEVIEEGVIKHFSHEKHTLKLKEEESDANDECAWCKACTYPIFGSPFYNCMECDDFTFHQKCAYLPKKIIDSFYKMPMTLRLSEIGEITFCDVCESNFEGLVYTSDDNRIINLDVRCGSISEPFVHVSHPLHSLYISHSTGDKFCNGCGDKATMVLGCEECGFALDINCSILPKMVKHKNDKDHFLSLCYDAKTTEQYWCQICEENLNPKKWFYSCDLCGITFHIKWTSHV